MRTPTTLIFTLLFCIFGTLYAQTEEQKKKMEEAEKKVAEAMRMQDSIMNTPQMKAMMEQIKEQQAQYDMEDEKRKAAKEKEAKPSSPVNDNNDFYTRNTISSDTRGKFANWTGGAADFGLVGHKLQDGTGNYKFFKMGTITAAGNVVVDLPESIDPKNTLVENNNLTQGGFLDFNSFKYTQPETPFVGSFTLYIIRNGKAIGFMTMGNSIKVAKNLAAPCCSHRGDEGYRVYWTYAKAPCAVNYDHKKQTEVWEGETKGNISVHHTYQLNFKPGWNIVKTVSKGSQLVGNTTYGTTRVNTIIPALPSDVKYFFEAYDTSPVKVAY